MLKLPKVFGQRLKGDSIAMSFPKKIQKSCNGNGSLLNPFAAREIGTRSSPSKPAGIGDKAIKNAGNAPLTTEVSRK